MRIGETCALHSRSYCICIFMTDLWEGSRSMYKIKYTVQKKAHPSIGTESTKSAHHGKLHPSLSSGLTENHRYLPIRSAVRMNEYLRQLQVRRRVNRFAMPNSTWFEFYLQISCRYIWLFVVPCSLQRSVFRRCAGSLGDLWTCAL